MILLLKAGVFCAYMPNTHLKSIAEIELKKDANVVSQVELTKYKSW